MTTTRLLFQVLFDARDLILMFVLYTETESTSGTDPLTDSQSTVSSEVQVRSSYNLA